MRCIESGLGGNDNTATLGRVDFEDILQTFCVHGNRFAALRPAQVCLEQRLSNLLMYLHRPSGRNMIGLVLLLR